MRFPTKCAPYLNAYQSTKVFLFHTTHKPPTCYSVRLNKKRKEGVPLHVHVRERERLMILVSTTLVSSRPHDNFFSF